MRHPLSCPCGASSPTRGEEKALTALILDLLPLLVRGLERGVLHAFRLVDRALDRMQQLLVAFLLRSGLRIGWLVGGRRLGRLAAGNGAGEEQERREAQFHGAD